jgi:hypothetical protein
MNLSKTRSGRLMEKHCVLGFWLAVQLCIAAYPLGCASSATRPSGTRGFALRRRSGLDYCTNRPSGPASRPHRSC